ncbi:glycosyltransferase [Lysinibacillus yapensis]|uniref:Glycosyltransferase n=1 Tax=Ureibacillus yapensis TaxID=2304605 RepID=A0A396SKL6_9BACL|nr:glycosyltransferase [Lysinibacillus yapensis]RHW39557.1 glycosyltransferase [Lysinibacillus yapensis]
MEKISFIIPVYNTEKYIRQCIDSILVQNLSNFEIIIIDDGSTDNSLTICNQYSSKHSNIHVFSQKNSGPSAARNKGIEEAKGKYIFFIDSDDYYVNGALNKFEEIVEREPDVDLVFGKIMTFHEGTSKKMPKLKYKNTGKIGELTGEEALSYLIKTNQIMISNYSALIKKELLCSNHIRFNEKIYFAEDVDFMLRVYCSSKNINFIDEFFLMYRKNREGQLTQNVNYEKLGMAVNLYADLIEKIDTWNLNTESQKAIKRYLSNLYFSTLGSLKKDDREFMLKYQLLNKHQGLIKYVSGFKFFLGKCAFFVFGFNTTVQSMQILKRIYYKLK